MSLKLTVSVDVPPAGIVLKELIKVQLLSRTFEVVTDGVGVTYPQAIEFFEISLS